MKRLIIGPCRSGTTMVLRAFRNHPQVLVDEFQSIKEGQRNTGQPDYSFFEKKIPAGKILVGKETIGYGTLADCRLKVFPDLGFEKLVDETIPLFCFRDPFRTFNSWLKNNLVSSTTGPQLFIETYNWSYQIYQRAKNVNDKVAICIYEEFCKTPEATLRTICQRWGITYNSKMLNWQDDVSTIPLDQAGIKSGHYDRVIGAKSIEKEIKMDLDMPKEYLKTLEDSNVKEIYQAVAKIGS